MRWRKFESLISESSVVFISDPVKNGNVEGVLRVLPAVLYSGFGDVTCPKSWLQLKDPSRHHAYEYMWHLIQDIDRPVFDIVAVTTQYYEDKLPVYSLQGLVNRYSVSDRQIVVIGNSEDFELSGTVRPFREDPVVDRTMEYSEVYGAYEQHYEAHGMKLPLKETKNLYLHDNANLYEMATGTSLDSVEELIEILPDAPYLPILDNLSSIFASRSTYGSNPLKSTKAIESFGKWLRRRIELDYNEAIDIARTINDYAIDHEQLFDKASRTRMPNINDARTARRKLSPEESPIHERYDAWLSNALQPNIHQ
ncbi:hypothetical protein [Natronobiforma cellulositropha]|uniref:hypothetical protein n=1 Tax=Natronobiforma cellulositropha TaxID=1679076 RepID=UPI0021D5B395|nr:hypothetical protein [Natronobiforma cellulositropha]